MKLSSQAIPCLMALLSLGACGLTTDPATGGSAGVGGADIGTGGTAGQATGGQGTGGDGAGGTTLDPSCSLQRIEDASLRGAVREVLGLSADEEADAALLATVTTLPTENVASLAGIECLPELLVLELANSTVSDLGPLTGVPQLWQLSVRENLELTDLTGLGAAGALTHLYLEETAVADLTPLTESSSLYSVFVKSSHVISLTPLLTWNVTPGYLNLVGNPLSQTAIEQEIPSLAAAGWCVISGPSEAERTDSPAECSSLKA